VAQTDPLAVLEYVTHYYCHLSMTKPADFHSAHQYSMYGHMRKLVDGALEGIKKAGGDADLLQ
jgi:hypothetical protein